MCFYDPTWARRSPTQNRMLTKELDHNAVFPGRTYPIEDYLDQTLSIKCLHVHVPSCTLTIIPQMLIFYVLMNCLSSTKHVSIFHYEQDSVEKYIMLFVQVSLFNFINEINLSITLFGLNMVHGPLKNILPLWRTTNCNLKHGTYAAVIWPKYCRYDV